MSAYQVCPTNIAAILNTYAGLPGVLLTRDNLVEIAEILAQENADSVNHRYSEDEPAVEVTLEDFATPSVTAGEALKLVRSLMYQSCEHPEWPESEAHGFCERFQAAFAA